MFPKVSSLLHRATTLIECRPNACAPTIFRTLPFSTSSVTQSFADFNLHDHQPTVNLNQHRFLFSGERDFSTSPNVIIWPRISPKKILNLTPLKVFELVENNTCPIPLMARFILMSCSSPAVRRKTSEEPATGWFNMCFAAKTQVSRTIRTSISLRAFANISSDFALLLPFSRFFRFLTRMLSLKLLTLKVTVG